MSGNSETYGSLHRKACELLGSRFEAGHLFTHVTQKKVYHLSFLDKKPVPEHQVELLLKLCRRRREGQPLQYLLGEWEFYGLPFKVGKGVLIPRADTETLVDVALELMKDTPAPKVLDLCSGTGCVAIAISRNRPDAAVTALELSDTAFSYLLRNIELNHSSVSAVQNDLKQYRHPVMLDLLVSNPPYVPRESIASLQVEVLHEPRRALDGGNDGLAFYRAITRLYLDQIVPGGWICLEVGIGQSHKVSEILKEYGCRDIAVRPDYAGIPRVVYAKK